MLEEYIKKSREEYKLIINVVWEETPYSPESYEKLIEQIGDIIEKSEDFLESQIRQAVEMTKEKLTLEQRHLQGVLGDDDYLIDVGYNQATQDLEELKKQI